MSRIHNDVSDSREEAGKGLPLRSVRVGLTVFFVVALALNGSYLLQNAKLMRYGPARDFWLTLATPVGHVCEKFGLDHPRAWLQKLAERVGIK
jgi:hypothetical protein